jgi:cobalamin biosynthesis protein CobD/CbiB
LAWSASFARKLSQLPRHDFFFGDWNRSLTQAEKWRYGFWKVAFWLLLIATVAFVFVWILALSPGHVHNRWLPFFWAWLAFILGLGIGWVRRHAEEVNYPKPEGSIIDAL